MPKGTKTPSYTADRNGNPHYTSAIKLCRIICAEGKKRADVMKVAFETKSDWEVYGKLTS